MTMRDLLNSKLQNEAGAEGGDSGGGADIQAQIAAAVEAATAGLKTKNQELLQGLSEAKKGLKNWEGLNPQEVRDMMERLSKDEELKLLAEGKHDEAWNKRLEKVSATHKSQLEALQTEAGTYKTSLEKAQEQIRDLVIDQQVLTGFMAEKGLESAAPDVVLRAKAAFKIEDGTPIARDKNGEIIRGKDGAITIPEWIASLKQTAPHLFPGSVGAGAEGGGPGSRGGDIDARMEKAANSGDMKLYRQLKEEKAKAK
jgi:hypothetical protein